MLKNTFSEILLFYPVNLHKMTSCVHFYAVCKQITLKKWGSFTKSLN